MRGRSLSPAGGQVRATHYAGRQMILGRSLGNPDQKAKFTETEPKIWPSACVSNSSVR